MSKQAEMVKYPKGDLQRDDRRAVVLKAWADGTTDPTSTRRKDLLRDKERILKDFLDFTGKRPVSIRREDVLAWRADLEARGLAHSTVYGMVSRVSSFYQWAREQIEGQGNLKNPVNGARPKCPDPYQSESLKSITDEDLSELLAEVKARAERDPEAGGIVGRRDYAILLHLYLTGRRRAEVIGLRWGDLNQTNGSMLVSYRVKGGKTETRIVHASQVRASMIAYLEAAGRLEGIADDSPLWTRHDRAGEPGGPLSSHAFAKNLKRYAAAAGLPADFHIHSLRHTFARQFGDESGSLAAVQEALGHSDVKITRVYLERVGVKADLASVALAERMGLEAA